MFLMFCNVSFADDLAKQLSVLKKLYDDGILTEEEFTKTKSVLLERYEQKLITIETDTEIKTETDTETKTASLPKKVEPDKKKSLGEGLIVKEKGKTKSSRSYEKMEMFYGDYKIYVSRPGTIKIRRVSDNKQLVVIQGELKVKYYNGGEGLFEIIITNKGRPTIEDDLAKTVEEIKETLKDPIKKLRDILTPRSKKKKDKDAVKRNKDDFKLEFKIDGVKLLHWEGRWVPRYKAFFYQVLTSGYQPFHFYIVMKGRPPFALNMEKFNKKIDRAISRAKTRLAIEYNITEAQIDKIIEEQTGRATEEAAQDAVKDAISAEVQAAIAQSVGEVMSEGLVNAIEAATGEAIDEALEAELAAAIDAEIAYAVSMGIEEAAVTAGWEAYFETLAQGGTDAQASANAYEACGSACDNY